MRQCGASVSELLQSGEATNWHGRNIVEANKWADRAESYPLLIVSDIGRKHLPHDGLPVNPISTKGEVYFITICCIPRGTNQLANSAT